MEPSESRRGILESKLIGKYRDRLGSIPAPGGNGCHVTLLGAANLGILAGFTPEQIFEDLRTSIPEGRRRVTDREIREAVNRAAEDHNGQKDCQYINNRPKPIVNDGVGILRKLIDQGRGTSEIDFWEASPLHIDWPPEEDPIHVFPALYNQSDLIYIDDRTTPGIIGKNIRTCSAWVDHFSHGGETAPHMIPNPLSGQPVAKKSGDGFTHRGDGNVAAFRFCMIEFDTLSREHQLAFWASVNLPINVLIDSGGKSVHGWLDARKLADIPTAEAWDHHIRSRLYSQILEPMGVDSACKNPSRLSRLPGHLRVENQRWQRVLYLSSEGRKIF